MDNPWLNISLDDYENHMAYATVKQLQTLSDLMQDQILDNPSERILIMGIAGGNGLEWIDANRVEAVYGIDINPDYLAACKKRYPELGAILELLQIDIRDESIALPSAQLVIADLFIEYVGLDAFCKAITQIRPQIVSCVLQSEGENDGIASTSPYMHAFDGLDGLISDVSLNQLIIKMDEIGYTLNVHDDVRMANGKVLIRADFTAR